ncbi:MBOAT family O-acyltransferase, partial [Helicobacter sp. T3_23-1059]
VLNIAESWATSLSYTFQLYFDFSGYCDMAMGLALMFGIVLPLNFNSPYKSLNIAEFWRRWHITLGRFLKECLYIPLGGNRMGKILNLRNLFIVAFLSGIWHGAGWGFVIWGVLHGVAMVIHRIYSWWVGNLSLGIHSADLLNRHKARTQSPLSLCRFSKNHESNTANTSIVLSTNDLNESSLRGSLSEAKTTKQSKNSPSLAEGDTGGGLKVQKNVSAQFLNNKSTHPPSPLRKGGGTREWQLHNGVGIFEVVISKGGGIFGFKLYK